MAHLLFFLPRGRKCLPLWQSLLGNESSLHFLSPQLPLNWPGNRLFANLSRSEWFYSSRLNSQQQLAVVSVPRSVHWTGEALPALKALGECRYCSGSSAEPRGGHPLGLCVQFVYEALQLLVGPFLVVVDYDGVEQVGKVLLHLTGLLHHVLQILGLEGRREIGNGDQCA